jgi:hypothetical protein
MIFIGLVIIPFQVLEYVFLLCLKNIINLLACGDIMLQWAKFLWLGFNPS